MSQPFKARKHESLLTLSQAARRLHMTILTAFVSNGAAPSGPWDDGAALSELIESDVIAVGDDGEIRAAYPFSPVTTAHRVAVADGPVVHAMCAIDALGMSAMLGRPVTIESTEPDTGDVVTVRVDRERADWRPDAAVVFAGTVGDSCRPAADRACGVINFFTSTDAAQAWADGHPGVSGDILSQKEALSRGIAEFADFLRH